MVCPPDETSRTIHLNISLYDLSVWVLPLVIAITFHEAAHGFVAYALGDDTAWKLGRVSANPLGISTLSEL